MLVTTSIADDLIKYRLLIPLTKIEAVRMVTDWNLGSMPICDALKTWLDLQHHHWKHYVPLAVMRAYLNQFKAVLAGPSYTGLLAGEP